MSDDKPRPLTEGRRNFPLAALVIYAQNRANTTGQTEYIETDDGILEIHPHPSIHRAYRGE